jgi:NAD(P)H-dependent flavin oxidoreductase YrpB (nitropropane dioxygenase family)
MKNALCEMLGIDFPLLAFSHCRDVVAAVSKAGGFGVLGASSYTPEELEVELDWIDAHIDGKPYGADILVPENLSIGREQGITTGELAKHVPEEHVAFADRVLRDHGIEGGGGLRTRRSPETPASVLGDTPERLLEIAFRHPIRLAANALGVPPKWMLEMGRAHGVPVAALVGSKDHAVRQVQAGADLIVAQGTEAGGHCGEVTTLVLIPEVLKAVKAIRDVPVVAAGGIMTGRQMAACMAMGAAGVWTGSVWLPTIESECSDIIRQKFVAASSRDTVRSKSRTGKFARQLRSDWTDAWLRPDSPATLPMPLQSFVSEPALARALRAAESGNEEAKKLVTYFVGQGIGLVDGIKSSRTVVQEFREEFAAALGDMQAWLEE